MPQTPQSTQSFLPISEIKDGILVLKTGGLRTVLMARGINFDLKSENEQNAIIYSYQRFVNSLNFPLQILIRSKKIDLTGYLASLKELEQKQDNELLRLQTQNYIDFVKSLTEVCNIMGKEFYIVVPYDVSGIEKLGTVTSILGIFGLKKAPSGPSGSFETNKVALLERTDLVINGLAEIGLHAVQLNTQELIELFYSVYNPETSKREKISDVGDLTTPFVGTEQKKS